MEYERIHKVQNGIISPSKLRMKLIGPHNGKKKDGNGSARTSPSRHEDIDLVKNGLLTSATGDDDEDGSLSLAVVSNPTPSESGQFFSQQKLPNPSLKFSKVENGNASAIHPLRTAEDENLDYDSNASSSSFEFQKERVVQSQMTRSLSRPMSSKWNDAEKWIMSKPNVQQNQSKKGVLNPQNNRGQGPNAVRITPDAANHDARFSIGKASTDYTHVDDYHQPPSQMGLEKFSFLPSDSHPFPSQNFLGGHLMDESAQCKDLQEVDGRDTTEDGTGLPMVRSVCMRDMGTEMTPVTSLEPSRSTTPVGASTPLRSPTSSIPTTPRRGAPLPEQSELEKGKDCKNVVGHCRRELSEQELKQKTRREIVALGVQLGKLNIAAWASKDDDEKNPTSDTDPPNVDEFERIECEKRAAVWEEAEKSKYAARHKREEIKIQAWESQQKAKLESELRKLEARVEHLHAHAQAKMVKKISVARQKAEEKRAAAEARKSRDAEKTAVQAEYIRQTGKIPPANHNLCCGWWW